jgi:hypothetical protein
MSALTDRKMPLQTKMRFAFNIALILLFSYTAYESWGFARLARYLPLTVSVVALLVMTFGLVVDIVAYRRRGVVAADDVPLTAALAGSEIKEHKLQAGKVDESPPEEGEGTDLNPVDDRGAVIDPADVALDTVRLGDIEPPSVILKRAGTVFAWMLGYVVGIAIVGIVVASAVYLVGYLFLQAKANWKVPVFGTILLIVTMLVMAEGLNLEWPDYLLEDTFESMFGPD